MSIKFSGKKSVRTALVCGAVAVFASGCSIGPTTYGTGELVEVGFVKDVTNLVTFGAVGKKEKKRIIYNERGALVIPPEDVVADIPRPIQKLDQVDDNFPGRADEIAAIEQQKARKEKKASPNSFIGAPNARPLAGATDVEDNEFNKTKKQRRKKEVVDNGSFGDQVNAAVGSSQPLSPEEALKTREKLAKERGVPIESIPNTFEERSILERAGLVKGNQAGRQQRLTDVPVEYRTVETAGGPTTAAGVDELIDGKKKKKKKKKRFIFF